MNGGKTKMLSKLNHDHLVFHSFIGHMLDFILGSLVHPKVVKSVHYCPATKLSTERTYRDATSIDGLPTYGLYPRQVKTKPY